MLFRVDDKIQIDIVPAGESPGRLTNISFRVIPDTHGEKFHDFASEIFV